MDQTSVLQNVTNAAVWGSLAASFLLGSFFLVQSLVDRKNRARFIAFALVNFLVAANDMAHPLISHFTYEKVRIVAWSLYAGVLLWVLHFPRISSLIATSFFLTAAALAWVFWKPELGTSMVVGPVAYMAAVAHALDFKRRRCYASCVLCGCSLALGLLSTFYYLFIASGDQSLIVTGYFHYAALNVLALLFGWIHFPRELSGRAPIRVSLSSALLYISTMFIAQLVVLSSLLAVTPWSLPGYLLGSLLLVGATTSLFFYHRHQLVIYTENVTVLLNERTGSLREAQIELANQNALQASLLEAQANEIREKTDVIERQRRLELAAQTAGQAAHDIRNLLYPVELQLSIFERKFDNHPGLEQIRVIKRQFLRLRELTDQLLALSRRGQLQLGPVLLNELLRDVSIDMAATQIRIEWEGEAWANANPAQLLRAVANLVSNAIDATAAEPGQVILRCGVKEVKAEKRCHMGFLKPGRYSFISVSDTGPGISPEIMDRMFEPFFSSKKASAISGSGLGLSIVAAVVSDHRGVLDIETSDSGTAFYIYLPIAEAPVRSTPLHRLQGDNLILIVDDDPSVALICGDILKKAGYRIVTAAGVEEAQSILAKKSPDLILLDLQLKDGTGADILNLLNSRNLNCKTLIYSNYLTSDDCRTLAKLGASRFAYKPLGGAALISAVEEALLEVESISQPSRVVSNLAN